MAIYSHVPPPAAIDGNVEQLQLQSLHISPAGVTLAIPLDDEIAAQPKTPSAGAVEKKRKERERRDSMKRREALLKGKEGSRRRQRWENGMSSSYLSTHEQPRCTNIEALALDRAAQGLG